MDDVAAPIGEEVRVPGGRIYDGGVDHDHDDGFCPLYHHAVELIGRRWNGAILFTLLSGRSRYTDIREAVPGLSDTMLGQRLRELELEGIVSREVSPGPPVRVDYRLTQKGRSLHQAIEAISEWADHWLAEDAPQDATATRG